tara:strand:- start:2822 stop:4432 length:1611 start_codon:yes stop_codon:yes gene_type:complete
MGYIKLFAEKDTFVQDRKTNIMTALAGPSANFGASETLEIANRLNPVNDVQEHFIKRLLIQFNLSALTAAINSNTIKNFNDPSVSVTLKMFNVVHDQINPESFKVNVYPVLSPWDEGNGTQSETSPISGYANWDDRKTGYAWNNAGMGASGGNGSFTASTDVAIAASAQSVEFNTGWENLSLDIKSTVNNWIDGTLTNNGLLLKLNNDIESITSYDVGVKKFYGKSTNTVHQPYIEIQYDNYIKDDRNFVNKGSTANLAFYNVINGVFQDITLGGVGSSTGNFLGSITLYAATAENSAYVPIAVTPGGSREAGWVKKGIYRTVIDLSFKDFVQSPSTYQGSTFGGGEDYGNDTGTYGSTANVAQYDTNFYDQTIGNDFAYFKDVWTIASDHPLTALSTSSITSTWKAVSIFNDAGSIDTSELIVNIKNLKQTYNYTSKAFLRLFIQKSGMQFAPLTAALDTVTTETIQSGWFKVVENSTNREVLPYLELDYDKDGNFFEIDMNNFSTGSDYRIILKFNYKGEEKILDSSLFIFSVI